eukprot:TRINITY_DN2272_c0_g1_i1.p1 TRINITY_DN2272_c0_g1~~TRINITY_DN2272_c0_g1_i1.p1  ORF type:complete len:489 (-),score=72.01 TRINITY_DN2272_c0_g1_i1:92-1372(-)
MSKMRVPSGYAIQTQPFPAIPSFFYPGQGFGGFPGAVSLPEIYPFQTAFPVGMPVYASGFPVLPQPPSLPPAATADVIQGTTDPTFNADEEDALRAIDQLRVNDQEMSGHTMKQTSVMSDKPNQLAQPEQEQQPHPEKTSVVATTALTTGPKKKAPSWADVASAPAAVVEPRSVVKKTTTKAASGLTASSPVIAASGRSVASAKPGTTASSAPAQRTSSDRATGAGGLFRQKYAEMLQSHAHLEDVELDTFDANPVYARVFVIKSYSEDDVHKCIKFGMWASTDSGNRRLNAAFHEAEGRGPVYLAFSVNASGQFCGLAQMMSPVDFGKKLDVWMQDKWNGAFKVRWLFIKDVPNGALRHITLPNNENKPVTNSRDTQEVLLPQARQLLRVLASHTARTTLLDDFAFYDTRAETLKEKSEVLHPLR